ncbi:MAG: hypothetical protein ACOCWR_03110 [Oceanidesulfovibrio sp.]
MSTLITIMYVGLGFIYAAVYYSLFVVIIRYFDTAQPVDVGNWVTWGLFIAIPALIASVAEKLLNIFDLREHESLLDTDPITGIIEVVSQGIPAFFRGTIWAVGLLIVNGIAMLLLADFNMVRDIATGLGMPL